MCRLGSQPLVFEADSYNLVELESPLQATHKFRMLFVNDDPFLLFTHHEQLKEHFHVEQAENGLQAVQMVCSRDADYYDVIVLDINMPIMDGFEACRRIYDHLRTAKLFDFRSI